MFGLTGSTLTIARKEFSNLLYNRVLLIILVWFLVSIFNCWYTITYDNPDPDILPLIVSIIQRGMDPVSAQIFPDFVLTLCQNGTILAIALGFVSMSEETSGKALNTLLVKPIYRDTIITGKLLGILAFVICVFISTAVIEIFIMSVYFGLLTNSSLILFGLYIPEFISMLPWALFLTLVCVLFISSLSMLMCLLFKEKNFALFMTTLLWIFFYNLVGDYSLTMYAISVISKLWIIGNPETIYFMVENLSVSFSVGHIVGNTDFVSAFTINTINTLILLFYCFVTLILTYIVFLRRDVA